MSFDRSGLVELKAFSALSFLQLLTYPALSIYLYKFLNLQKRSCKKGKLLLNAPQNLKNIYNHRKIIWQTCGMSEKVQVEVGNCFDKLFNPLQLRIVLYILYFNILHRQQGQRGQCKFKENKE